jgi:hypothetical protein
MSNEQVQALIKEVKALRRGIDLAIHDLANSDDLEEDVPSVVEDLEWYLDRKYLLEDE